MLVLPAHRVASTEISMTSSYKHIFMRSMVRSRLGAVALDVQGPSGAVGIHRISKTMRRRLLMYG